MGQDGSIVFFLCLFPRMFQKMREQGHRISRYKLHKLMRQEGLQGLPFHRKKYKTARIAREDLVQQNFHTSAPNQIWCSDITQTWTKEGWLYCAVVIDLYSRRVVGLSTGRSMQTELPLRALKMAWGLRHSPHGVIHHSDRGSQYTSTDYLRFQAEHQIRPSFGAAGTCLDNAVAESFFSILKRECLHRKTWSSRAELEHAIKDFVFHFYNTERIRSNGKTPLESEQDYAAALKVKVAS